MADFKTIAAIACLSSIAIVLVLKGQFVEALTIAAMVTPGALGKSIEVK